MVEEVKIYELSLDLFDGTFSQDVVYDGITQDVYDMISLNGGFYKTHDLDLGEQHGLVLRKESVCLSKADFKKAIIDKIINIADFIVIDGNVKWYFLSQDMLNEFIDVYNKYHKTWIAENILIELHKTLIETHQEMKRRIKEIKTCTDDYTMRLDSIDCVSDYDFYRDVMSVCQMMRKYRFVSDEWE